MRIPCTPVHPLSPTPPHGIGTVMRALPPTPPRSPMTLAQTRFPVLLASSLLLLACVADFDLEGRDACSTDADCIGDRICVRNPGQVGRCIFPADPASPGPGDTGRSPAPSRPPVTPPTSGDPRSGTPVPPTGPPPSTVACDGVDPARFLDDPANCGACGVVCAFPNATARCDDGQCRIARCDDGFADRNRLPDDGCETPCDDGQLHCRDFVDDRCDGPEAAHWPACNDTLPLEGRRYAAFLWDTNPAWGEVQTGRLAVQADTPVATLQQRVAGNVLLPGRGRAVASSTWDLQRTTGRALELRARDGSSRFLLRQPIDGTNRLLVGIEDDGANPTGRLLVLVETFVSAQRAIGLPEHRALIANPSGETSPIPGGSTALGWVTPMQLPLFRFGPADLGGAEVPLVVPLIEYRDEVRTAPPDGTLVPLDWRLTADGTLRILRPSGQSFGPTWDKVIEGATTLDGHLAFAVARWTTAACPTGMNRVSDNCVPDPVLYASITRNTPAVASLDGPWALVGIAWRPRGTPGGDVLDQRLLDLELLVQGGAITGPAVVGRAERHEDRDTGHPLLRIDLSGPGVSTFDRERLVLEGHVAPGSRVGLFWDRTPRAGFPRPIHGGLFLLLRQDETPR